MTDLQKKHKEIAIAFFCYFWNQPGTNKEQGYNDWLLTEEGKRLTAEESDKDPLQKSVDTALDNLIEISKSMVQLSEHQLDMKKQLDRFEGRLKGSLFGG